MPELPRKLKRWIGKPLDHANPELKHDLRGHYPLVKIKRKYDAWILEIVDFVNIGVKTEDDQVLIKIFDDKFILESMIISDLSQSVASKDPKKAVSMKAHDIISRRINAGFVRSIKGMTKKSSQFDKKPFDYFWDVSAPDVITEGSIFGTVVDPKMAATEFGYKVARYCMNAIAAWKINNITI